jgi:signal peptidase I
MEASIGLERQPLEWRQLVFGVRPHRTLVRVLLWGYACLIVFHHMMLPIKIVGSSMWPTYQDGALNMVNKLSYHAAAPARGDVVALHWNDEILLKRIVGVPGDTVEISRGRLLVNGQLTPDEFGRAIIWADLKPFQLRGQEYFVIGDNRESSFYGKIRQQQLVGKLVF